MVTDNHGKTKTSSFGVSKREGHDSSKFYERNLYDPSVAVRPKNTPKKKTKNSKSQQPQEILLPAEARDTIFLSSSENMAELPDNCIHLAVTSPPYNVGKEYDEDLSLDEYLAFLKRVFEEVFRVLTVGARFAVNIANLGRKPYIPLNSYIARDLIDIGFLMRGEIIWDKGASAGASTAWGSWQSPSNPVLRDVHEYILIFSKEDFSRKVQKNRVTISKDDFLDLTKSIWSFPSESAKRIGHPAPFPTELPRRLCELYTQANDVVLDPFMGAGTTAAAAKELNRSYVGYEIDPNYVDIANQRLEKIPTALSLK